MGKKSIRYLDQKLTEDSTLSSMMIIVPLEEDKVRFDCKICGRNYRHHPSLFRHFRSAHKEQYAKCLSLRKLIQSERKAAKLLGIPYPRRKNRKRNHRISKTKKEKKASEPAPELPNLQIQPSDILTPVVNSFDSQDFENIKIESAPSSSTTFVFIDLTCKICSEEFDSEHSLINHIPECQEKQHILNDLERYLMNTSETTSSAVELPSAPPVIPVVFPCNTCKLNFHDEGTLNDHMKTQHFDFYVDMPSQINFNEFSEDPTIACSQCNKLFSNDSSFYQHACFGGNVVLQVVNA